MISLAQTLELIRSISFAALVTCFFFYLAFTYHPTLFPEHTNLKEIIFVGSALGTILHRALHSAIFNPLTRSVARSLGFYVKVVELDLNRRAGVLTEDEYRTFGKQMKCRYFGMTESPILMEPTTKTTGATLGLEKTGSPQPELRMRRSKSAKQRAKSSEIDEKSAETSA
jgi:hypothetical protein